MCPINKLADKDENILDKWLLKLSKKTLPFWYRMRHTPNTLTTYKCTFGLLAWYNLMHRHVGRFGVCAMVAYFFDCADGQMARAYKMETKFGDRYDHYTDVLLCTLYLYAFQKNYRTHKNFPVACGVMAGAVLAMLSVLGCQQRMKANTVTTANEKETLDGLASLCIDPSVTRYWGCAPTLVLFIAIIAWLHRTNSNRPCPSSLQKPTSRR
jgi:phosphatidylglycerophosphate synthase